MSSAKKHLTCKIGSLFFTKVFHVFRGCLTEFIFCCCRREANSKIVSNSSVPIPKNCRRRPEKMEYYSIKEKKMFTMSSQSIIDWTNNFFVEANKPKNDKCSQFCVTSVSMSRVEPAGTITVRIDLKSSAQIDPVSTQRTTHCT